MRVRSLIAVVAMLAASWAAATDAPLVTDEEIIALRINGQEAEAPLLVRRDADGVLLVRTEDFQALRLKPPQEATVVVDGVAYFRLGAAMGADVRFDGATQSAEVNLPADAFVPSVTVLSDAMPHPATVSPGAFLNYNISTERVADVEEHGALLELGAFDRHGVLTSSMIARDAVDESGATRLDTTFTYDMPVRLATLRVGDAISAPGAWGHALRFGGVQFGTNFATQPTLVTTPLLAARGEAVVPSTVDVFINGQRVARESVQPGPFAIENLPPITGAGELQVIVTDALGRQQVLAQPYYSGPTLLRAGLNEFSFEGGAIRNDYALESFAYGDPFAAATFRRGFTDSFTAEVHAEAQADGANAIGVDAAWQLGTLGVLSATSAVGTDQNDSGWLAGIGIERSTRRVHVFGRTQLASEHFVQIGLSGLAPRPKQRTFAGGGLNLDRFGTVQLAWGYQSYWDSQRVETLGATYSLTLGAWGYVSLFANHTRADSSQTDVYLGWTMPLGKRRTVGSSLSYRPDVPAGEPFEATATLQQNLPAGSGTGYRLSVSSTEDAQASVSYQGHAGEVGIEYSRRDGVDGWRASALGGLTLTGAGVLPTRWLDQSFAVVQVADYPDLTVYVENQPIGRTDAKGRVLLDHLRPYDTNHVSLDPAELPLDAALANPMVPLTPAFRSGAVVRFPITRATAATMRLVQESGEPVPAGAHVHTPGGDTTVALDGLIFLTDAAGYNEGWASWSGNRCRFAFQRMEDGDPMPDLGEVSCRAAEP
jgi:outer membrane usher protein